MKYALPCLLVLSAYCPVFFSSRCVLIDTSQFIKLTGDITDDILLSIECFLQSREGDYAIAVGYSYFAGIDSNPISRKGRCFFRYSESDGNGKSCVESKFLCGVSSPKSESRRNSWRCVAFRVRCSGQTEEAQLKVKAALLWPVAQLLMLVLPQPKLWRLCCHWRRLNYGTSTIH